MFKHFGEVNPTLNYVNRIGVYGIAFNQDNQVALVRVRGNKYFLPGGGIEQNESHSECLEREFLEETGYQVKINCYLGHNSKTFYSNRLFQDYYIICHYYFVIEYVTKPVEVDHELIYIDIQKAISLMTLDNQADAILVAYQKMNEHM